MSSCEQARGALTMQQHQPRLEKTEDDEDNHQPLDLCSHEISSFRASSLFFLSQLPLSLFSCIELSRGCVKL